MPADRNPAVRPALPQSPAPAPGSAGPQPLRGATPRPGRRGDGRASGVHPPAIAACSPPANCRRILAVQRFTISLDDDLAAQFDALVDGKGYENRSEAVRDLIRTELDQLALARGGSGKPAKWCVATVSYVFDHTEQLVSARVLDLQHDQHDVVVSSLHTHLDHDNCLETVVLRGRIEAVRACAEKMVALRGVRHGNIHVVPLEQEAHGHAHGPSGAHRHYRPRS